MKQAARDLDALPLADRDFATVRIFLERIAPTRFPSVVPEDLRSAWAALSSVRASIATILVTREQLSVRSEMSRLLKMLQPGRYREFTTLFAEHAICSIWSSRSLRFSSFPANSWSTSRRRSLTRPFTCNCKASGRSASHLTHERNRRSDVRYFRDQTDSRSRVVGCG
jgi:hypothetical protein